MTDQIDELKTEAANALGLPSDEERAPKRTTSAAQLKKRAIHRGVVLPSGAIVDIKLPNLGLLIKSGQIPNDLIQSALKTQNTEEITQEIIEQNWAYTEYIIPLMLIEPKIKSEDVGDLDPLDIEMLSNFAARRTAEDALGRQLGGLDTQQSFREVRDVDSLRSLLGGA